MQPSAIRILAVRKKRGRMEGAPEKEVHKDAKKEEINKSESLQPGHMEDQKPANDAKQAEIVKVEVIRSRQMSSLLDYLPGGAVESVVGYRNDHSPSSLPAGPPSV